MAIQPTKLELRGGRLSIAWSDGTWREYTIRELRDACPCASCREKRREPAAAPALLPVLTPQELAPLTIGGMRPVGHYAYQIDFSDGHGTGIYPLELLRQVGRETPPPEEK